jgi:hypothetical protein
MGKLFLFGCSYTAEYDLIRTEYRNYYYYRGGNFPPTWGQLLAKKLNLELVNFGLGANGNDEIFQNVCQNSFEFQPDDVVIIGWSYMFRFRWTVPGHKQWSRLSPHNNLPHIISETTTNEIVLNRTHRLYIEQVYDFEKIIERLSDSVGFKVFFWSSDNEIIYCDDEIRKLPKYIANNYIGKGETIFHEVFRRNGQRIVEETNGKLDDLHFGETGHFILSELFHSYITNKLI